MTNPKPHGMWSGVDGPNPPPKGGRKPNSPLAAEKTVRFRKKLDDFLGQAHMNVERALKKGDVPTSRWLIEHLTDTEGNKLPKGLLEPLISALDTLEDVATVSKQVLLLAIQGDMTFGQLKFVQEALARHSVLAGVVELRRLRDEVAAMVEMSQAKSQVFGKEHLPTWGKLAKDVTPTHTPEGVRPAE